MPPRDTESTFELTTLQRLDLLKYRHAFGMDIECPQANFENHFPASHC